MCIFRSGKVQIGNLRSFHLLTVSPEKRRLGGRRLISASNSFIFISISKYICFNFIFSLQNIFVSISKYICFNFEIYLFQFQSIFVSISFFSLQNIFVSISKYICFDFLVHPILSTLRKDLQITAKIIFVIFSTKLFFTQNVQLFDQKT